jgi:hypothetical protein
MDGTWRAARRVVTSARELELLATALSAAVMDH